MRRTGRPLKRERLALLVSLILVPAAGTSADEIVTADGAKHYVTVLRVTGDGVVVKAAGGEKIYNFDELEAASAYQYMKRTVGEKDAEGHLRIGKYCLKRKLLAEAKTELLLAKGLDPKLENEVNTIWAEANAEHPRRDLTPEELERVLVEQRGRSERVREATGQEVRTLETDHFIVHSTFPKADDKTLKDLSERLYKGFDRIFRISQMNDRMWDGKCVMYYFKDRDGFVRFATEVHHFPAQLAGGYFRAQGGQCEVVIPNLHGLDRFKETMVHEGAHAFLHFYRDAGHVPAWVQEGVAQYFEFDEFPKSSTLRRHNRLIVDAVKSGKVLKLETLAASRRPSGGADTEAYAYCYSYVGYLVHKSEKDFADFVRGLKSGMGAEEALQKTYGWDFATLQKNWLNAVSSSR